MSSAGAGAAAVACESSPDAVVELLRAGLPTYDYNPAKDLSDLIDRVDLVLTGTLLAAQRVEDPGDFEASTRIEVAEARVLSMPDTRLEGIFFADPVLGTDSIWALDTPDPLGERVEFDSGRTRFVAFLHHDTDGEFRIDPQGLHIGCLTGQTQPVIAPLPPGFSGGSADDLTAAIQAIVDPVVPRDEDNFDSIPYRLLAEDVAAGEAWTARRVSIPTDANPAVGDFEYSDPPDEAFFEFVLAESGSCPLGELERLEFDRTTRLLYPVLRDVTSPGTDCTADANPHLIFVAVSRQDLPTGPFAISVSAKGWPALFEPIPFVDGELTRPDAGDLEHPILGDPAELAVGETGILIGYTTHCDASYLWWQVDGRSWVRGDDTSATLPADWIAVERDQEIDLVITRSEPDRIDAVARNAASVVTFVPDIEQEQVGCD